MNEVPARDSRAIALSIARIEGMLSARLQSIEAGIAANAQALVDHVREEECPARTGRGGTATGYAARAIASIAARAAVSGTRT